MSGSWPPPSAGTVVGNEGAGLMESPPAPVIVPPPPVGQTPLPVPMPVPPMIQMPTPPPAQAPESFEPATQVVGPDPTTLAEAAAAKQERKARRRERRRNRYAVLLIILATGLFATAAITSWVNARLLSTTGYVSTVQSAASDPAVVGPVTTQLLQQVGQPLIDQGADQAAASGQPFDAGAFDQAVVRSIDIAVASPVFVAIWNAAQTTAQTQARALVDGAPPTPQQLQGNQLILDLSPLQPVISAQLVADGYAFAATATPPPGPLAVRSSSSVESYTKLLSNIASFWWLLPLLALAAAAGAYALSTRRPRLTLLFGIDLMLAMGAVILVSRLLENVAGERGFSPQDQQILQATYTPLGAALQRSGVIGVVIGGLLTIMALVTISVRASRERRVRSQEYREALAARQQAADASPVPAVPNQ